ncbi:MAG: prepilin-type N-terminal cleavage/methylation domain-containing protein [Candidatus Moranbacteria bacterium]|nr:prepilin-type N-terminal cleavage/methylation domain-containing protein [Candidatus Moranbacteria bacterium]
MKKGFTLVELLLVIALIMIVGMLSAAFYTRFLMQNNVINTTTQLVGSLRKAQMYSMMGKRGGSWGVAAFPGSIVLFQGNSYASRDEALDEVFVTRPDISTGDFSEIVFAKTTGLPDIAPTIVISEGGETRTLTVSNQGIVSQ